MKLAYYNEHDPRAAAWLRELIANGLIAPGEVDERSIVDVRATDLAGFRQCHFFAGISGWSRALRLAGWPDDRPVWTGSCPCQPFSCAGARKGVSDERHLWPAFRDLIGQLHPPAVFGEQVASSEVVGSELEASFVVAVQRGDVRRANRLAHRIMRSSGLHYHRRWLDGVRADMAPLGYSVRPLVLGAHSVGAPHIRQRLYWMADLLGAGLEGHAGDERNGHQPGRHGTDAAGSVAARGGAGVLADASDTNGRGGDSGTQEGTGADGERRRGFVGGGAAGVAADRRDGVSVVREAGNDVPMRHGTDRGGGDSGEHGRGHGYYFGAGAGRVADAEHAERWPVKSEHERDRRDAGRDKAAGGPGACGAAGGLGASSGRGCGVGGDAPQPGRGGQVDRAGGTGDAAGGVDNTASARCDGPLGDAEGDSRDETRMRVSGVGCSEGAWDRYDILPCRDGKARRVESGTFPLAHGIPGRMGLLRGYGNAIVPPLAAEFIKAAVEATDGTALLPA